MPKRIAPLSDLQVSKAKPKAKDYKLADGGGMYLLVTVSGGKLWRLDYRFQDKRKTMALGQYPAVTLADARQRREAFRKLLANGVDPAAARKEQKEQQAQQACTFETVARDWYQKNAPIWSKGHAETVLNRLVHDVFPSFGEKPIAEITAADVRVMLLAVGNRGAIESAARIKIICGQVFRYAVNHGLREHDPSAPLRPSELFQKREKKHFAAITEPKQLAPLLRAIDEYQGTAVVTAALRLAPMLFVRPGELRYMEWTELDLDAAQWNIPGHKMKMKQPHLVPLARQAVSILRALHALTGTGRYVFSGRTSSRPMSENTVNAAMRYMGYDTSTVTGHGFRATARTILDEVLGFRVEWIECQLAHAVRDANGRAYNRTSFLKDRARMMQQWADYLDGLKQGAKVLPLRRAA